MFDAEARYGRDVISGRIKLPSQGEMLKHNREWRDREEALENPYQEINSDGSS